MAHMWCRVTGWHQKDRGEGILRSESTITQLPLPAISKAVEWWCKLHLRFDDVESSLDSACSHVHSLV